ncbi:hypothetical protein [Halostagnicola kamekurae]|uniref:Uncharacterized protein n=1 Tax=Halostagnicola kamekurae TaxID=619731 RepID=A0A1I6PU74_9EURY|nr:hypothetical protein [Halostagnicola kamekurae]SFS43608.1 hypothetical protein SAMN04488556_0780 [Halostagnicola kamekurae]
MDSGTIIGIGTFSIAAVAAVYQLHQEQWPTNRTLGTGIFLVGVAIEFFLEDLMPANATVEFWLEPVAGTVMIIGFLVTWFWQPD